jgi:hypothetical protein
VIPTFGPTRSRHTSLPLVVSSFYRRLAVNTDPPIHPEDGDSAGDDFAPRPWERQRGESLAAWTAFQCYRDLGANRSLDEVDRRLYQPPAAAPAEAQPSAARKRRRGHIGAWSRRFDWVQRAAQWDAHLDREGRAAHIEAVKAMNQRHAAAARQLQMRALQALSEMQATDLAAADVLRFLVEACKLERLAIGEVTDRTENKGTPVVLEIVERIVPVRGGTPSAPALAPDPDASDAAPVTHRLIGAMPAEAEGDPGAWEFPDEPPQFLRPAGR